ncbi:MAG: hypothetical protein A3J51_01285 [Omnitrophica WOR_2 bacterium RIFCSPHIGHO2_02_FULL_45_21]|nr:MAG: hypothetical protein A3J51_01285 [Omnitrophica WOR_2 bacterium RIFCSPHIGHO2_02_FULL_45_21]
MRRKRVLNYKKELEAAAKSMILIHEPQVLIKMIVRMIVQRVGVKHAGILLHHKDKDTYVLTVSRGEKGLKVPAGFVRMDADNPLISFFRKGYYKNLSAKQGILEFRSLQRQMKNNELDLKTSHLIEKAIYQMEIFETEVCVPSFFGNDLLGILLLGAKQDNGRFRQDELDFFGALASDVAMALRNAQLFRDLEDELQKRRSLFIHTTVALAAAVDAKDHYTHGHISRVTNYSLAIGEKLREGGDFDDNFMENLHIASLLHDIGKIGTPEKLLNKTSELTMGERKIMQKHVLDGVTILQSIKELGGALAGVKYHHERYDGKGYPDGLEGKQIPLLASIIAVADTFDAMTTDRPYRKAMSKEEARMELKRCSGSQFDPEVVRAALEGL